MGPVSINVRIPVIGPTSSRSVDPEEPFNLLPTVPPHPFHNEVSQLPVDFLLAAFAALAVRAIIRVWQVPGDVFSPRFPLLTLNVNEMKRSPALSPGPFLYLLL
jgi:hypothetical protein